MQFGGIWQSVSIYVQAENRPSKRRLDGSLAKSLLGRHMIHSRKDHSKVARK